ncbi:MAG TPA: hypothetical protein ENN81_11120 [Phycisphaerales bacterium]|nr:hypothetical protein [Phycisphaerales bacterium]
MSSSNQDRKETDNMEVLKQQASSCAPGCDCHAGGPLRRKRVILGTIVLLVAVALVARAVIKTHEAQDPPDAAVFVSPIVAQTPPGESVSPTPTVETARIPVSFVGREIGSLSDLNTLATATDAVFVYVPGKDGASGNPPATAIESAAKRIGSQGFKIDSFTLKAGTRDHDMLAAQMPVPGVLAAVKGRGMIPVSGDITEAKLIQGFVAASNAGDCGPSGCAPGACN